jgi:pentatricopeptide repeat protein
MRKFATQGGLVTLTPQTYGSLFKAYGQARDIERLWELWNEMEQRQVVPTQVTVGCFVDALVKNGCAEDALVVVHKLLRDPVREGLVNNIIFSTLLKGFAMTKQVERLFAVYEEMKERGVLRNTVTYNTMLDACARCGCMGKAPALMADMRSAGTAPDKITYSTLMKGHCFSGDVDAAFVVLKEMREDGKFTPDEILYNSLLDGCAKEHRLQEALDLFAQMRAEAVRPSNFTLCTLIKLLGRARRLPQAFGILEELCRDGGLRPNIQVYTCLMTACLDNGQLDKALQLQNEVIESGCEPDAKMYNALVRGCLRAGSVAKAVEVVRCSYRLPGQHFTAPARAVGVDAKVLEELVVRLNRGGRVDGDMAHSLVSDLKRYCGINMQDSVYAQVVQRAARGGGVQ